MSGRRYEYFEVGATGRYDGVGEILAAAEREKRDGVVELVGVEPASLGCCPHCGCIDVDPLDEGWDELVCTACGVTWRRGELPGRFKSAEGPEGGAS